MDRKYNCPNCGAPIGYSSICPYCGTTLFWLPMTKQPSSFDFKELRCEHTFMSDYHTSDDDMKAVLLRIIDEKLKADMSEKIFEAIPIEDKKDFYGRVIGRKASVYIGFKKENPVQVPGFKKE